MMPDGSFDVQGVSGGTLYDDSICPSLWLPRRASYIYKYGILGNLVETLVVAGATIEPPYGYKNQSFRWIVDGKPVNPEKTAELMVFNIQGQSSYAIDKLLRYMPPVDCDYFMPAYDAPPAQLTVGSLKYPPVDHSQMPSMSGGTPDLVLGTLPPRPGETRVVEECIPYKEYVLDPEDPIYYPPGIEPPPIPPDLREYDIDPPIIKPCVEEARKQYLWADLPDQYLLFKQNNETNLQVVNATTPDWFNKWENFGSTARMNSNGDPNCAFDNFFHNTLGYYQTTEQYQINDINAINTAKKTRTGHYVEKNEKVYVTIGGNFSINLGEGYQDPIRRGKFLDYLDKYQDLVAINGDVDPKCEVYSNKLPKPEITQTEDVASGVNESNSIPRELPISDPGCSIENTFNGAEEYENIDFSIPCKGGLSLEFTRNYSSSIASTNKSMGPGWSSSVDEKIEWVSNGYIKYFSPSGQEYTFTPNRDENGSLISWAPPPQIKGKITLVGSDDSAHLLLTTQDGMFTKTFATDGHLVKINSTVGGEITTTLGANNKIIKFTDTYSNRSLNIAYDNDGRVVSVDSPENRNWTYAYDTNGDLSLVTNPISGQWSFVYNSEHVLQGITNPRSKTKSLAYQNGKVVSSILQGVSSGTQYEYSQNTHTTIVTDPDGTKLHYRFDDYGQLTGMFDNLYEWIQFDYDNNNPTQTLRMYNQDQDPVSAAVYDSNQNVSKLFDLMGEKYQYTYTSTGKIATSTDREGKTTTITWDATESLPIKVTDALGREVVYEYDTNKNLIKTKTPYKTGETSDIQLEYDSNGYVKKITNALGKISEYTYNNCGDLITEKNPEGKITTYTVNKMGSITKITGPAPDNKEMFYTYDANQNITEFKNQRGYSTYYEYNDRDLLTSTKNTLNQYTYYSYNASGKLVNVKDQKNNQTTMEYDSFGRLSKVISNDGKFRQTLYDGLGRVSGYKDNLNNESKITYDLLYRPIETETPEGAKVKYEYDKEGNVKKVIDPLNRQVTYDYDNCYQVTKVTNNAGKYSTIEYWPSGQVKKTTDPLGHIAEYDYNKLELPTSVKDNAGNETTTLYDDLGRCTKVTNPLNQHVDFEYDMYGNVTKSYNELGKYTTYEYDANGNCTKMTTPLGRIYQWTYDELDRVKKTISPLGFEYVKTYDDVGNLVQVQDPLQKLEKYEYTDTYNVKKHIDQINNETAFDYDSANQLSKVTLPKGTYQQYTYDKDNQLKTVTDPLGNIAQYVYNLGGELTERKLPNPSGGTTSFTYTYDSLGRRTGFTDEASQTTTCTYNDVNQVTRIDHPNGEYITSTFDNLSRITGVNFGGGQSFSFAYDQLSRTTSATDQHGTKSISYDAASRVTSVTDPFGDQTTISYDDDDRVTSVTTPLGATSTTYDNDSRPTQITLATGGQIGNTFDNINRLTHSDIPNGVDVDFSYNDASWVTQKTYSTPDPLTNSRSENDPDSLFIQTGKMASWVAGQLPKNPTYADLMKLNLSKMPKSSPYAPTRTFPTIASFSYTYDNNQNVTQRTYPGGTQSFTYDNYDRLTQAVMPDGTYSYTYDSRSNRTTQRFVNTAQTVDQTTSYTYSIDDRLISYSVLNNLNQQIIRTASYTYDNAGNTTQKQITEGGNTYTTSYTYYDDNRIHTVTLPNNDVITYTYHADGTRATKTTPTEYIEYRYAGSLIKEVHMNPANHSQVYFTLHFQPSRMIYDPLAPGGGDEIKYYTVADTQGTVYKLLDYQGSTVAEYTYDPFGNILTNSAPTIYNPVGFAGTYYEQDTGLYYAQSRYLDPTVARFTTKDSYRGDATSIISQNRYAYCAQNPTSFVDPSGFAPAREEDGTKNVLIKDGKFTDDDTSGSIGSVASSSHTSAPRGNAIKAAPDDVITNANSAGKNLEPPDQILDKGTVRLNNGNYVTIDLPKPGETVKIGEGEYLTNINGVYLHVTVLPSGKLYYANNGTEAINGTRFLEANRVAVAINAALQNPNVAVSVGNSMSSISTFNLELNKFAEKHFTTFGNMYKRNPVHDSLGSEYDYTDDIIFDFFYNATVGYAVAWSMINAKPGSPDSKITTLLAQSLENYNNTYGTNTNMVDFLMSEGFWASYFNKGLVSLSFDRPNNQAVGFSSKITFMDIVRLGCLSWILTSIGGTYNGGYSNIPTIETLTKLKNDIVNSGVLGEYGFLVDCMWDIVKGEKSSFQIINSSGVTLGILDNLLDHGLNGGRGDYINNTDLFVSTGLMLDYYSKCLNYISMNLYGSTSTNYEKLEFGDALYAMDKYISVPLGDSTLSKKSFLSFGATIVGHNISESEWGKYHKKRYGGKCTGRP